MPYKAGTACTRQGCPGVVKAGVCSACGSRRVQYDRTVDENRPTAAQRGYDGRWQRVRAIKLKKSPLCERCEAQGETTAAYDVHHILSIRVAPHLRLVMSNLMSVCRKCHAALEREVAR